MKLISSEEDGLQEEKVALLDLEGTLTQNEPPLVDCFGQVENLERLYEEKDRDTIGYWSVFHTLTGEDYEVYNQRFSDWISGDITKEEFEGKNTTLWNKMLDESRFETAEELLDKFNEAFLNLRPKAEELVETLKTSGFAVGLVSHAPDRATEKAAEKLDLDFIVPNVSFVLEDNRFTWIEENEVTDDKSKALGFFPQAKDMIFIGNGGNDFSIADKTEKAYLIENRPDIDYTKPEAYTGSFEQVLDKIKRDLNAGEKEQ